MWRFEGLCHDVLLSGYDVYMEEEEEEEEDEESRQKGMTSRIND